MFRTNLFDSLFTAADRPDLRSSTSLSEEKTVIKTVDPVPIEARQFGQRLVANQLENSPIEGQDSLASLAYWIEIVSLFLKGEGEILETGISPKHFAELKEILEDYSRLKSLIQKARGDEEDRRKCAQSVQMEIKEKLSLGRRVAYLPLGYAAGPLNEGHAIPLKFRMFKNLVEGMCLNLGEGVQMHPELMWNQIEVLYHFQSFPIHFDPEILFGPKGENMLCRLIRLQNEEPGWEDLPYCAEDCYGPFLELGTVQSTFDSKLADRAEPAQRGPICADMATLLIIKDLLIDLGYQRVQIESLILNEKYCALISFYAHLERKGSYNEWSLLKKGVIQYAVDLAQAYEKKIVQPEELSALRRACEELSLKVERRVDSLKPLPLLHPALKTDSFSYQGFSEEELQGTGFQEISTPKEENVCLHPPKKLPAPERLLLNLKIRHEMLEKAKPEAIRASYFVIQLFLLLPVPNPFEKDYWDAIPSSHIPEVLRLLALLVCKQLAWKEEQSHYLNIIAVHTAYAIADKLARRVPEMRLEGFASPFYGSSIEKKEQTRLSSIFFNPGFAKKEEYFEFDLLPFGAGNRQWNAIRRYFETQDENCQGPTLFALSKSHINVTEGVRTLQSGLFFKRQLPSPESEHLSYLQQFFPKDFKSGNVEQLAATFAKFWLNREGKMLPAEYEPLYFLAYSAWTAFTGLPNRISDWRGVVKRWEEKIPSSTDIFISFLGDRSHRYIQRNGDEIVHKFRNREEERENGENKALCLQRAPCSYLSVKTSQEWRRIFSTPEMRVTSIIQWLRKNLSSISSNHFSLIECGLFEPSFLDKKICEEPNLVKELHLILRDGITYFCKQESRDHMLFCIRTAILLESFAPSVDSTILIALENDLLNMIEEQKEPEAEFYHLLLLYRIALPRNEDSAAELAKAKFYLKYYASEMSGSTSSLPHWLVSESRFSFFQSLEGIGFSSPSWKKEVARHVLRRTVPDFPQNQAIKEAPYPFIKYGDYTLDLENCLIKRGHNETLIRIASHPYFKLPAWSSAGKLISLDGNSMLKKNDQGEYLLFSKVSVDTLSSRWYRLSSLQFKLFENEQILIEDEEGTRDEQRHILIGEKCLVVPQRRGEWKIFQLRQGRKSGLVLANQRKISADLFSRLKMEEEFRCWSNPKTDQIQEIDLFKADLLFRFERGEGYLSMQFPDYLLAAEQSLKELNHYRGSLVLSNGAKLALILPSKKLRAEAEDFSPVAVPQKEYFCSKERYFFYTVDQVAELLISDDPLANLYLVLLFSKQRDYKKAFRYLERAHSYKRCYKQNQSFSASLMQAFLNLKDESPEALAFYLHLALFYLENASQLIHDHYGEDNQHHNLVESLCLWTGKMYARYIPALSSHSASPVPYYCRLTPVQETLLLSKLKHVLKNKDELNKKNLLRKFGLDPFRKEAEPLLLSLNLNWIPSLEFRERLLVEKRVEKRIPKSFYPAQLAAYFFLPLVPISERLSSYPPIFSEDERRTPLQEDFVRISLEALRRNFPLLYERARKGSGTLDIYYILRSEAGINSSYLLAYAALLHYIGNYPRDFSDLNFGEEREKNLSIFRKIVERASRFYANLIRQASVISNLYRRTVTFSYSNKTILALPPSEKIAPLKWEFSEKEQEELSAFREEVYTRFLKEDLRKSTLPIIPSDSLFAFDSYSPSGPTEKELVETLRAGHRMLADRKSGRTIYGLKEGRRLDTIQKKADLLLQKKRLELRDLKEETEKLANRLPKEADLIFLRKLGQDLPTVIIEEILTAAYEQQNPALVQEANPLLTPKEVRQILFDTIKYHLLRIQILQLEKAAVAPDIQAFGEALALHTTLCPTKEPELYLYQSCSGKILWHEQARLIEWYYERAMRHRLTLFAAPAGVGKTTLFQPIAMKWLQRKGYFPVSASPTPLYLVDREGLRSAAQQAFDLQIAVCELALGTKADAKDFQWLFEKLSQYQTLKGLKLTPSVYLALLLKYELALECEDVESVRWISLTLDLFKRKSVGLIDEARQNASPFSQSEIGIGKPLPLPPVDRKVFVEIYRALTSKQLLGVVGLTKNLQATVDPELYPEIKAAAFRFLVDSPYLDIPEKEKKNLLAYWMSEKEEPEWLLSIAPTDQGRALELVKIYFEEFFYEAMKCVGNMQHRPSQKIDEEIHLPARKKQASDAYFKEVYATLITTIQGTLQIGLSSAQAEKLLKVLKRAHVNEVGYSENLSETEKMLRRWLNNDSIRLYSLSFENRGTVERVTDLVSRNPEAILFYLEHCVLQQVTYCPEQLVVTPIHFLNAFQKAVLFSADPGPAEMYALPEKKEAVGLNTTFLAHVIHKLSLPENSDLVLFPIFTRPLEFFEWLYQLKKRLFIDLKMIADAGGALRDFSNEEIRRDFFAFLEAHREINYDGLILFAESSGLSEQSEQLLYLKGEKEPKILKGNDIVEALTMHGLRWESLNLLTFIDPSHCTGANIKQPPQARALLLLGEDLTIGDLIQGVMRLREFLHNQTISWGASFPLARKIEHTLGRKIDPLACLAWTLQNEGVRIDNEILLSAYQQITYLIEKEAREELEAHLNKPEKQISTWKKYRSGFVSQYEWDPIRRFKIKRGERETRSVLMEFAQELYSRFSYSKSFKTLQDSLNPIIGNVDKRKPTLSSSDSFSMKRQTQMRVHQEQKRKLDLISVNHTSLDPDIQTPLPKWLVIDRPDFLTQFASFSSPCKELFGSKGLTEGLFLTHNLVQTAQTGASSLGLDYLKPANYFLLIEEEQLCALALSDEEASFFQKQLISKEKGGNLKIALICADGNFAQNGRGSFAFSPSILTHTFVQDCVIDLGLMQCRLYHPLRFSQRITHWNDFWPLWLRIKKSQPSLSEIEPEHIERLVPKHIKEGPQEEKNSKSFFQLFTKKLSLH
ncbi:MAG: hypothetical protein JJU12_03270 [Chlamydiales bacterium]|nr:hypothetical protein [Chlamydiales bacterium]